jgi:6-phosphofructokinase 1
MKKEIKTIGVLTSGGDAPGMNATLRAVVRTAAAQGIQVKGIRKGFIGLLNDDIIDLTGKDVADILHTGGTFLYTARCEEFKTVEGQKKGAAVCEKHGLDGLVVIGGDGSFQGARRLSQLGVNVMCIPVTIDNDVASTDYTIGFDTAVNTAMQAIDKIRETSTSHERCSIVEVMGRGAGYLALWCGIANGAEDILMPEQYDGDMEALIQKLADHIMENRKKGKTHHIIVNAEGIGHTYETAEALERLTGIETRATIIGYMQRGGSPTAKDRMLASAMGAYAIRQFVEGKENQVIGIQQNKITSLDLTDALRRVKEIDPFLYEVSGAMGR